MRVAQNPTHPNFNHAVFDTYAALIVNICRVSPSTSVDAFQACAVPCVSERSSQALSRRLSSVPTSFQSPLSAVGEERGRLSALSGHLPIPPIRADVVRQPRQHPRPHSASSPPTSTDQRPPPPSLIQLPQRVGRLSAQLLGKSTPSPPRHGPRSLAVVDCVAWNDGAGRMRRGCSGCSCFSKFSE